MSDLGTLFNEMSANVVGFTNVDHTSWESEIDRKIANLQIRLCEIESKVDKILEKGVDSIDEKDR